MAMRMAMKHPVRLLEKKASSDLEEVYKKGLAEGSKARIIHPFIHAW
jgi:hypothetical protein